VLKKRHKELIDYVYDYVDNTTNDWFTIKTQLVQTFPPKERKLFAKRHFSTKKRMINNFDREIIVYWEDKSGSKLVINQEQLHPDSWVQKPVGWALKVINEEKRKNKSKKD